MRGGKGFKFLTKIRPSSPIKVSLEEGDVGIQKDLSTEKGLLGG